MTKNGYKNSLFLILIPAFLLLTACTRSGEISFDESIEKAQSLVASGALHSAVEELERAAESATGRNDWYEILDKLHDICAITRDYASFRTAARDAHTAFKGDESLAALRAYGELRSGSYDRARDVVDQYLVGSTEWKPLIDEIHLTSDRSTRDDVERAARKSGDPQQSRDRAEKLPDIDRDPGYLVSLAERFSDNRFLLDAALLYARQGKLDRSARMLSEIKNDFPVASALILYDAERFDDSIELFSRLEDDLSSSDSLIYADALLSTDKPGRAVSAYEDFIESENDLSWIPYANTARYHRRRGDSDAARSAVESGKSVFPQSEEILLEELRLEIESSEQNAAVEMVGNFRERFPSSISAAYLDYELRKSGGSRTRLVSLLWEAYLSDPSEARAAWWLATLLRQSGNIPELDQLIGIYADNIGRDEWYRVNRAVVSVSEGRLEDAADLLHEAVLRNKRWQHVYNRGLVDFEMRKLDSATESFRSVLLMIREENAVERAKVRVDLARVLREKGNTEGAAREATYALDLDSDSLEAYLLLRELESPNE